MTLKELQLIQKVIHADYELCRDWVEAKREASEIVRREIRLKLLDPRKSND